MAEEKKPFSYQDFQNKLNDTSFLKNLRTVVILIIVIGVPLLYFGLSGSLTLDMLMSWKLGGLAIMSIALVKLVQIDTKSRAFDDEVKANTELNETENEIIVETKKIDDHIIARKFVKTYNIREQKEADESKTEIEIENLKQKISFMEIKGNFGKKYKKLQAKLKDLQSHPLRDKVKPIVYDELYNYDSKRMKKQSSAKQKLTFNPKKENFAQSITNVFLKGFGIGGAGSLPFMIGENLRTIVAFYFALFIAIVMTVLQSYIKTRYKTAHRYLDTRKFKLSLLKECNEFIIKEKAVIQEQTKKAAEIAAKTAEEKKDLSLPETNTFDFPKLPCVS